MCIRAYLNGDGQGYSTHLSLFFVIMQGEFDNLLKWPFEHKVSLILVGKKSVTLLHIYGHLKYLSDRVIPLCLSVYIQTRTIAST